MIGRFDTEKLNAANTDNGWVQYTVYLKASSYAATTFTVNLGLGRTNNVSDSNYEYVQGYAFFDDLKYEVMTAAEYDTATAASARCPLCGRRASRSRAHFSGLAWWTG